MDNRLGIPWRIKKFICCFLFIYLFSNCTTVEKVSNQNHYQILRNEKIKIIYHLLEPLSKQLCQSQIINEL
jgi:hypothetical protein